MKLLISWLWQTVFVGMVIFLRREDGHVLRRALDFEVEGERKNGRLKRTWKK